jgi:hypothetical protein
MADRFEVGTAVRAVVSKWGARPHWEFEGRWLGADEHGEWVGLPAGTRFVRPGRVYVAPVDQVSLVPANVDPGVAWLATFHAPGGDVSTYVDVTTRVHWSGTELHAVDLDLDVVRWPDGRVTLDDEDEFAANTVAFGYPPDLVEAARLTCEGLEIAVRAGRPPFDGTAHLAWLDLVH